jgi:hypothetical protein
MAETTARANSDWSTTTHARNPAVIIPGLYPAGSPFRMAASPALAFVDEIIIPVRLQVVKMM